MLSKLGRYILHNNRQAVLVMLITTPISLLFPPVSLPLSGVPLGLVSLRRGIKPGLQVLLGMALVLVLAVIIRVLPMEIGAMFLLFWLAVWLCAIVLYLSQRQGMMIASAGLLALFALGIISLYSGNMTEWWQGQLSQLIEDNFPATAQAKYKAVLLPMAPLINALLAAASMITLIATLLLSRWWQSMLFYPGGFGQEFRQLRLPAALLWFTAAGLLFSWLATPAWGKRLEGILLIMLCIFLFQGLSLVHRILRPNVLSRFFLTLIYVLLLFLPKSILLLAGLGMADSFLAQQKRLLGSNR